LSQPAFPSNRLIALSCALYQRLLALYPAEHRREFGPALAQLFHDQCRDAWNTSRSGGLALLWFRVLLDLAKTSAVEHCHNLMNRTLGLNQKLNLFLLRRPLKSTFLAPFKWVLLGAIGSSVLLAWTTPSEYRGKARVALETEQESHSHLTRKSVEHWTPAWRQAQVQGIASDQALGAIIHDLKLNESITQLRERIYVTWAPLTTVIEINVYDRSVSRAADIANALAATFVKDGANQRLLAAQFQASLARAQFVDMAKPFPFVAGPNRPLIIFTGLFGGAFLSTLLGSLGVLLALRLRHSMA
jgi:capsular polysaccharide biosynthesis protein